MAEELKNLSVKKDIVRRKHIKFAMTCIAERNKLAETVIIAKKIYEERCETVNSSALKFKSATDEKTREKLRRVWHEDILMMNNSKNMYILALHTANTLKERFKDYDSPKIALEISGLESSIHNSILKIATYMIQSSVSLRENLKVTSQNTLKVLGNTDTSLGAYELKSTSKPKNEEIEFVPCGLWRDKGDIVKDEFAVIYLHNKLLQLRESLYIFIQKSNLALKGIQGSAKLLEVYTKNPLQGNPDDVKEDICEQKRQMHLLVREIKKLEIQVDFIVKSVGDLPEGSSEHNFTKSAFAIPTRCSFCNQMIFGLMKTALSCTLCNFYCHVKCRFKFVPKCSGQRKNSNTSRRFSYPSELHKLPTDYCESKQKFN